MFKCSVRCYFRENGKQPIIIDVPWWDWEKILTNVKTKIVKHEHGKVPTFSMRLTEGVLDVVNTFNPNNSPGDKSKFIEGQIDAALKSSQIYKIVLLVIMPTGKKSPSNN